MPSAVTARLRIEWDYCLAHVIHLCVRLALGLPKVQSGRPIEREAGQESVDIFGLWQSRVALAFVVGHDRARVWRATWPF